MLKYALVFLAHHLMSTFGVIIGTAAGMYEGASLLNAVFFASRSLRPGGLLTELPGFPLQTTSAVVAGFLLASKRPHNTMFWVWIVPWLVLFVAAANTQPLHAGLFSYFFGRGCLVVNGCFTQLAITLPALTSTGYVAGAFKFPISALYDQVPHNDSADH